jgi:hypothetical protein
VGRDFFAEVVTVGSSPSKRSGRGVSQYLEPCSLLRLAHLRPTSELGASTGTDRGYQPGRAIRGAKIPEARVRQCDSCGILSLSPLMFTSGPNERRQFKMSPCGSRGSRRKFEGPRKGVRLAWELSTSLNPCRSKSLCSSSAGYAGVGESQAQVRS